MDFPVIAVMAATLTIATPLVFGALGALLGERAGVLNLGIEGTMYVGAFTGFLVAARTGSLALATGCAVLAGALAGALMALLTVTLGVNQHVAGIGTTLLLVAASDFTNRQLFGGGQQTVTATLDVAAVTLIWEVSEYTAHIAEIEATGRDASEVNMQWSLPDAITDSVSNLGGLVAAIAVRRRATA